MAAPPSRVCPQCGSQDYLDPPLSLPEGGWQFVCRGPHGLYVFDVTTDNQLTDYPQGLAADLGLYEDLPRLITETEHMVEYGVVEYRYGSAHQTEYQQLLRTYGHRSTGRTKFTASMFIAGALGRLLAGGDLNGKFLPATGYWSYNGNVSYWCPAGSDPAQSLTWYDFALQHGLDPATWPLTER